MKALLLFPAAGLALLRTASLIALDWPQWRGPLRNGVAPESAALLNAVPAGGLRQLWDSEMIPSNDEGGLGSVVAAKGRAYLSVVWHSNVPTETRQIDDLVLRQLGFAPLDALGPDVVKQMEAERESLDAQLRGKRLDEHTD